MSSEGKTTAIENLKLALAAIGVGRNELQEEVVELSEAIQELRNEENKLLQAPISFEDYSSYIKAEILKRGNSFASATVSNRQRLSRPGFIGTGVVTPHKSVAWNEFENGSAQVLSGVLGEAISGNELCYFFGDLLHERLLGTLRSTQAGTWGNETAVPSSERLNRLKTLTSELDVLIKKRDDASMQIVELDRALANKKYD